MSHYHATVSPPPRSSHSVIPQLPPYPAAVYPLSRSCLPTIPQLSPHPAVVFPPSRNCLLIPQLSSHYPAAVSPSRRCLPTISQLSPHPAGVPPLTDTPHCSHSTCSPAACKASMRDGSGGMRQRSSSVHCTGDYNRVPILHFSPPSRSSRSVIPQLPPYPAAVYLLSRNCIAIPHLSHHHPACVSPLSRNCLPIPQLSYYLATVPPLTGTPHCSHST